MTFTTRLILSSFLLLLLSLSIATIITSTPVYNIANAAKRHSHSIAPGNTNKPTITATTNTPPAPHGNVNSQPAPPVVHNTRARAAAGGPTLNDPDLKL